MEWFDLILLGVAAVFIVKVILQYRRIKKEKIDMEPGQDNREL